MTAIMRSQDEESRAYGPGKDAEEWVSEAEAIEVKVARLLYQCSYLVMRGKECLKHLGTVELSYGPRLLWRLELSFWRRFQLSNKPSAKPRGLNWLPHVRR